MSFAIAPRDRAMPDERLLPAHALEGITHLPSREDRGPVHLRRPWWQRWLPPRRRRAVPWTAPEVFLGLLLVMFVWHFLVAQVLAAVGFFPWFYGEDLLAIVAEGGPGARLAQVRVGLWVTVLAFPLDLLTFPVLFYLLSGTRPYQLGLTTHRAGRNLLAGLIVSVPLVPLVYGVYLAVAALQALWLAEPVEEHPFVLLQGLLGPAETAALLFAVLAAAPILEELEFRGVLLRWCGQETWRSHLAAGLAVGAALILRLDGMVQAFHLRDGAALLEELLPTLFVLAVLPLYALVIQRTRTPEGPAIVATSLLFAAIHSFAWPSPVPLFVLALGLGWLAQRTQSLLGPILIHSLFNAVGCVVFFAM
jgi:membrane protease YdiL (CAAX protease family)